MSDLTLIVISYNSRHVIEKCLSTILTELHYNTLIVDNAGSDKLAASSILKNPHIQAVTLDQNIGYGRAANIALKELNTRYALLLNPDLHISPHQVESLLEKTKRFPNAAISAPATQKKHQKLGSAPQRQSFINGSCMLLDMNKIREIGFFDEKIFLFSEETDLCMRCATAGYDLMLFPDIHVNHIEGESSGQSDAIQYMRNWHFAWSRSYYNKKHKLNKGKQLLLRRIFVYWYKSVLATSRTKRIKYKANLAGLLAFKRGESAFKKDGNAKASLNCKLNPYCKAKI
jgi:N-acetylglucosaminyl-diphospho-decaprenol L-rhamnosyltransferase